jgi:lambda family phage minor tail protein L
MEKSIHNEIMELEPSTVVILYELVLKGHAASYYFHSGENGYTNEIVFQGNNYYYIPIKTDGFDFTDSKLPRPTLTVDNTDSFFSLKTRFFKDFIGFTFKRTRTFVKFLADVNFPSNVNPFGTPTEVSFPVEQYVINKKNAENQNLIQFELVSPLEKESAFIPNRKIVYNTCQWKYRSNIGCGYNGLPVTDIKGNFINFTPAGPTQTFDPSTTYNSGNYVMLDSPPNSSDPDRVYVCVQNGTLGKNPATDKSSWIADDCPKNISGCRCRFQGVESTNGLPFGGFPGTWEY